MQMFVVVVVVVYMCVCVCDLMEKNTGERVSEFVSPAAVSFFFLFFAEFEF